MPVASLRRPGTFTALNTVAVRPCAVVAVEGLGDVGAQRESLLLPNELLDEQLRHPEIPWQSQVFLAIDLRDSELLA